METETSISSPGETIPEASATGMVSFGSGATEGEVGASWRPAACRREGCRWSTASRSPTSTTMDSSRSSPSLAAMRGASRCGNGDSRGNGTEPGMTMSGPCKTVRPPRQASDRVAGWRGPRGRDRRSDGAHVAAREREARAPRPWVGGPSAAGEGGSPGLPAARSRRNDCSCSVPWRSIRYDNRRSLRSADPLVERSDVSRSAGPGLPPDAIGDRHRAASQKRRCPAAAPARPAVCRDECSVAMKSPSLRATGTTSGLASGPSRYPASREGVASSSSDTSRWLPIRRRRRPPSRLTDVPSAPLGT